MRRAVDALVSTRPAPERVESAMLAFTDVFPGASNHVPEWGREQVERIQRRVDEARRVNVSTGQFLAWAHAASREDLDDVAAACVELFERAAETLLRRRLTRAAEPLHGEPTKAMAFVKKHDKEFFFKYTDAHGVRAILSTLTLLWKSPLEFNDPFDTPFIFRFGFSPDEVPDKFAARLEQMIFCDDPVPALAPAKYQQLVAIGRFLRQCGQLDAGLAHFGEPLRQAVEGMRAYSAKIETDWPAWLGGMRVFCVSEIHDDLLMWAHYADCHKGAVIQLRCIPEKDTALCAAEKVQYQLELPLLARTVDEWVAHLCGDKRIDIDKLYLKSLLTKSEHWSYEREWRCAMRARAGDDRRAELMTVDPEVVAAVYLGCRMTTDDRDATVKLVRERLPHVKLFQARQSTSAFKLEFDAIA